MKALGYLAMVLVLAVASTARAAIDPTTPARVRIIVVDESDRPVAGATVRIAVPGSGAASPLIFATDDKGEVRADVRCPPKWPEVLNSSVYLDVSKTGYAAPVSPPGWAVSIFPAAELSRKLVLTSPQTTLVRFRNEAGEPVPFVRLRIRGSDSAEFADARGEYRYVHERSPLPDKLGLQVGTINTSIPNRDVAEITLSPVQIAEASGAWQIEGKVVLADGTPARGWRLGWLNDWTTSTQPNPGDVTFYDFTMSNGPTVWLESVWSKKLTELDQDGAFSIFTNDRDLMLLSPEGIPFRYALNPSAWPSGTHRIALQVPKLLRIQSGQVLFTDGKPVADRRLTLVQTQASSRNRLGWSYDSARGRLEPASPALQLKTDDSGRYRIPVYAGDDREYGLEGTQPFSGNFESDAKVVVAQPPVPATAGLKHVRLTFWRANGQPVPELAADVARYFGGWDATGRPAKNYSLWTDDREGGHLFVPEDLRSLELRGLLPGVSAFRQTIPLAPDDDQTIRVTVPDSFGFKPLRGTVLDPDGKPVAGVSVAPFSYYPPPIQSSTRTWGLGTVTDEKGKFAFDQAPDEGGLMLNKYASNGAWILPGWTEAPKFSLAERELTIRLARAGSLRIRLPQRADRPPDGTVSITMGPGSRFSADYDPPTKTLVAPEVRPGRYILNWEDRSGLPPTAGRTIEVEAGQETVVDLSDQSQGVALRPPVAQSAVTAVVLFDGRPLAGASVHLGGLATRVSGSGPARVQADTSDTNGRVYFRGDSGTTGILYASVPGRASGEASVRFGADTEIRLGLK